ncbi:MAG: peptidoglycan-binding domain-containing protein, partial [Pseudomonadota bacterium]
MRLILFAVLVALTLHAPAPISWAATGILAEPDDFKPVVTFKLNRENRRLIQDALGQRGYDVGRPDGKFGAKTRRGIKLYQTDRGDAVTGKLTEEQIKDLLAAHGAPGVDMSAVRPSGFAARKAARGYGGECTQEATDAVQVHSGTQVRLKEGSRNVGEHMTLSWRVPDPALNTPLYLVLSFDASVRFGGTGFYALTPNAEGPFGISWESDKIRAIVPLTPSGKGRRNGSLQIKPMRTGPLRIESAIVQYVRNCMRETAKATGSFRADIFASPFPEILADDATSLARASHRLLSATSAHYIDVFEGYFELVEKASGRRIARINGKYPGFSPAGHFFYAQRGGERFFGDVRSGRIVYAQKGTRFHGWTKNDSFAAFGNNNDRELTIVPMLIDNGEFLPKRRYGLGVFHFALNVETTGSGDVNQFDFRELFELNLENNFLLVSSEEAFFLYGLDRTFERVLPNLTRPKSLREIEQRRLANINEVNRLLRSRFGLTPFAFQVRYTYHALYNFNNHLVASGFDLHNDAPTIRRLQQGIQADWRPGTFHLQTLAPVTNPIVATRTAGGTVTSRSVAAGDWRGFARVSSTPRPPKKIFQRLEEFGVPFAR